MIYAFSHGIPRLINIFCDFLLLAAYVDGKKEMEPELIKEVIGELDAENRFWEALASGDATSAQSGQHEELTARVAKLEQAIQQHSAAGESGPVLAERLSELERKTAQDNDLHHRTVSGMADRLAELSQEVARMEKRLSAFEQQAPGRTGSKGKGLWGWITG